ncbi:hypothetical protein [Streptosporangium sp. V21-05]|uniref:hypothetical protein n=1 Tax=Streptosporangium sp. V21-05 TaxID=3446115 RepID=UPI003F52A71E
MSADLTVYRSTHPDVLGAWHAAEQRAADITTQRKAFLAAHGFEGRSIATKGRWMIGVAHPEDQPIPDGWRLDRDLDGAIVPARRTRVGKQLGKRLDQLAMPSARKNLPGGMPEMAWGDHHVFRPGITLINNALIDNNALYVKWGCDPEAIDSTVKIDPAVWQRMKLSEYYAVLEAQEAAQSEDAGAVNN